MTIEHAFGETTIEEEPTRVATLGWTDQDHAVALGVVPAGATEITWGGNADGSSDRFDAAVEEVGAQAPLRYDDTDGAPIDEVAQLDPDVILATNSGLTEAEYAKLSKIAPVVAFPDFAWTTPWQTSLAVVGEALGRTDLAAEVEAETKAAIDAARQEHPELDGASLIYGYLTPADLSTIGIYAPQDPRVSLLRDFGMVDADAVDGAVPEGEFYGTVSAERASELDSDVLLTWVEKPSDAQTFVDDTLLGQVPAIAAGHFYAESDKEVALASTNLARGLGRCTALDRVVLGVAVVLLAGTATALAGPIAFVGLVVPHAVRALVGSDHARLLPFAALGGAALVVLADTLGRIVLPPSEVQVGVMAAVVGVPVFLLLIRRGRSGSGVL